MRDTLNLKHNGILDYVLIISVLEEMIGSDSEAVSNPSRLNGIISSGLTEEDAAA
jgi:hypothetical protein